MGSRGFTLVELMAVIAIIGILATIASPVFVQLIRDQRVNKAALEIADMYRLARIRSIGRGTAVMVRWSTDNGKGLLTMKEAISPSAGGGVPLPAPSCVSATFTDGDAGNRDITAFDFTAPAYELAATTFYISTGTAATYSEICFSPRGRTYVRTVATGAFAPLVNVPTFTVINSRTSRVRTVYVPPNGVARLAL